MEKRKSKVSNSYRGKASDYYLDCSCHLSVSKATQNRRVKAKSRPKRHMTVRAH